jgi:hypothetical protein
VLETLAGTACSGIRGIYQAVAPVGDSIIGPNFPAPKLSGTKTFQHHGHYSAPVLEKQHG